MRLRSGSNARCRPLRVQGAGPVGGLGVWGETQFPGRPGPNTDPSVPETNLMVRNDGLVRVSALGTEGYSRPAPAGGGVGGHWVTRRGDGGRGRPEQAPRGSQALRRRQAQQIDWAGGVAVCATLVLGQGWPGVSGGG